MKLKRCVGENNIEADGIKQIVKKKYGEIAAQGKPHSACSCCSPDSAAGVVYTIFSEDYSKREGYNPDADPGLGCVICSI